MANIFGGYPQPMQYPQYQQPQQNNTITVVPVQGETGASMYPVAAGNTVFLIDFDQKKFWIKATDINCLPSKFAAFEFKEVTKQPPTDTTKFISRNEFDEWKTSTDAQLKRIVENLNVLVGGNSNVSNAQ